MRWPDDKFAFFMAVMSVVYAAESFSRFNETGSWLHGVLGPLGIMLAPALLWRAYHPKKQGS